jgi:hypothetical protein
VLAAWALALRSAAQLALGEGEQAIVSAQQALATPVCAHGGHRRVVTELATATLAACHTARQGRQQADVQAPRRL